MPRVELTDRFVGGSKAGDYFDAKTGTTLSQLLAVLIVIVSVGALALTVCLSLVIILAGGSPPGAGTVFPLTPLAVGPGPIMAA